MADGLPTLRERLRQQDPELAADLDLQWRIANSEWLPAVSLEKDSSNSGPHLANIESHLDATLTILHQHKPSAGVLEMRPIEVYMMLAAVLFHDLGRTQISSNPAFDHGRATNKLLAASYQNLGVRNREVALSLGRICESHTADPEDRQPREHKLKLGDVVIDPYGQVRERMIAALLTLGDHMDSAQTRVVPDYLRPEKDKQPVGAFRNVIRGVVADPASRCIRTVLVADDDTNDDTDTGDPAPQAGIEDRPRFILNKDAKDLDAWTNRLSAAVGHDMDDFRAMLAAALKADISGSVGEDLVASALGGERDASLDRLFGLLRGEGDFDATGRLVAWRILQEPIGGNWPRNLLVAVVLGDLRSNRVALRSIREQLAAVGLPLATWLVEHQERLYTPDCHETYEPVLHRDYLSDVVAGMWELSTRVFGVSEFTYRELASQLGERNVARVRTAARRIAIVTTRYHHEYDEKDETLPWPSPIWIGDEAWKWRVDRAHSSGALPFGSVKWVEHLIDNLAEPDDPGPPGTSA